MDPEASRITAVARGPWAICATAAGDSRRGRAMAAAIAARRSVRAAKSRIRLSLSRRSVSWRALRMKSMAGNGVGRGRRRKKRWTASGIAAARRPQRSAGLTKPRFIRRWVSRGGPLAPGEEREEDLVDGAIGAAELVVDVRLRCGAAHVLEPAADELEVALAHLAPVRLDLPVVLHGEEEGGVVEGELELGRVEDVEHRDVVAAQPELRD